MGIFESHVQNPVGLFFLNEKYDMKRNKNLIKKYPLLH